MEALGFIAHKSLACIAHKSLEIFERCRLWQRNLQLRWQTPLLFAEKSLKTVCFDSFIFNQALKQARSACLRARNELVALAIA